MRRTQAVLLVLLMGTSSLTAQDADYDISGNVAVTDEKLISIIDLTAGVSADSIAVRILRYYRASGYRSAVVKHLELSENGERRLYTLEMEEGEQYFMGKSSISISGDFHPEKTIDPPENPGEILTDEAIRTAALGLAAILAETGYPFAAVDVVPAPSALRHGRRVVDIVFKISPGEQVNIDTLLFTGGLRSRPEFFAREVRFRKGMTYSNRRIRTMLHSIEKLDFVSRARENGIAKLDGDKFGLIIDVAEKSANRLGGILGYVPEDEISGGGYATGQIELSFGNLLGTGRSLGVKWDKIDRHTESLFLGYTEPYPFDLPLKPGFSYSQLVQDSSFVRRETALAVDVPLSWSLTLRGGFSDESVSAGDYGKREFSLSDYRTRAVTGGVEYDVRDNPFNPVQGIYYYSSFTRTWTSGGDFNRSVNGGSIGGRRISVRTEFYRMLLKRQVLAVIVSANDARLNSNDLPYSDLYRLGGAASLRGYREDQFRSARTALANLEYRFITGRLSRVFFFTDFGFLSGVVGDDDDMVKTAYGVGIRTATRLGVVGIDYGLGEGDSFSTGKVHMRLEGSF